MQIRVIRAETLTGYNNQTNNNTNNWRLLGYNVRRIYSYSR